MRLPQWLEGLKNMRKVFLKFYGFYYRIKVRFMSDDAIIASVRKDIRRAKTRAK